MAVMELTSKYAQSAQPQAGKDRTEIFDSNVRGLCLRITKDGSKSWSFLYTNEGKKRRYTMGPFPAIGLADARDHAKRIAHEIMEGNDPVLAKKTRQTILKSEELVSLYLERYAKRRKKSWLKDAHMLAKNFTPIFQGRPITEIKRREVINLIEDIVSRGSPIQANRVFQTIRRMFNFAIEQDLLEHSPCYRVKLPSKENQRDRVLTPTEINAVWSSLNKEQTPIAAILKLMLLTAQRCGEVRAMEWQDIDMDAGMWIIPGSKTKNGAATRVPLCPMTLEIIRSQPRITNWVFPGRVPGQHLQWLHKAVGRIKADSGVDYVPHDLRRTAATMMASIGVNRQVIRKILNHVDREITAVYDRYSYENEKRDALMKWEGQLRLILTKAKENKPDVG